jgi:hypothetical protein
MPRDQRLYMTFPNDFWQHPKIAPLSDAAFRTFVEINGYSRMQDLDGRVPVTVAKRHWKVRALNELLRNHPDRPSLTVDGDDYVIWNYDQHQETKASRAKRQETNRANGLKGGRPRSGNRTETDSVSGDEPTEKQSQSQSPESEDKTDITHPGPSSTDPAARDGDRDQIIADEVERLGIRSVERLRRAFVPVVGAIADPLLVIGLTEMRLNDSTTHVTYVESYIEKACTNSPDEIRADWDRLTEEWTAARAATEATA